VNAAIDGFEFQKRRIDSQIAELRQLLNGDRTEAAAGADSSVPKRKISAAARRRMAAAQKARWAKGGAQTGGSTEVVTAQDGQRATQEPRRQADRRLRQLIVIPNPLSAFRDKHTPRQGVLPRSASRSRGLWSRQATHNAQLCQYAEYVLASAALRHASRLFAACNLLAIPQHLRIQHHSRPEPTCTIRPVAAHHFAKR
jgi:hypothetical protein